MTHKFILFLFSFFQVLGSYSQIIAPVEYQEKMGYIDTTGNWYIEPKFEEVDEFLNDYAAIYMDDLDLEGLINYKGEIVLYPGKYTLGYVENGMIDLVLEDHQSTFFNVKTKTMMTQRFQDVGSFSNGLAKVQNNEDKWGVIDKTGNLLIPFKYDKLYMINDSTFSAELNGDEMFIYSNDQVLKDYKDETPNEYHSIDDKLKWITDNNEGFDKYYLTTAGGIQDTVFWYQRNWNKFGLCHTNGKVITLPVYDRIDYFTEGVAPIGLDGKFGFIYPNGEMAIELQYENVGYFKYGLAAAKINGKWGFINLKNEWVIEPIFDYVNYSFHDVHTEEYLPYEYSNLKR